MNILGQNEKSFILDCLHAFVNESTVLSTRWNHHSLLSLDWDLIVQTSQKGRILPFLVYVVEKENRLRSLFQKDRLKLQSFLMSSDWENQKKMVEFKKIKDLFKTDSIPLIPLKGIALSCLVYDKAPYRYMSDIDILIREIDLQKTKGILSANGFMLSEPKNRWQAKPMMKVIGRWSFIKENLDLDLQWGPKFFIEDQFVSWDCEGAWQRAEPFKQLGDNVFMLSAVDQVLYLSLQVLNDIEINSIYVSQLLDLALVMKKFKLDSDIILRKTLALKPSLQNKLFDFIRCVEVYFLKNKPYSELPAETIGFFDLFFEFSSDPHHDFAVKKVLRLIQSPWERILFIIGYFIPSQSVLRKKTSFGFFQTVMFFLEHWRKQCSLFLKLLLKQR